MTGCTDCVLAVAVGGEFRPELAEFAQNGGTVESCLVVLLKDIEDNLRIFDLNYAQAIIDVLPPLSGRRQPFVFVRGNHEWRCVDASSGNARAKCSPRQRLKVLQQPLG